MKKSSFFKSLPFKLLVGVVIGILAGLALNANDGTGLTNAILNIIVTLKYVLGQIISFCVPLIIIGFIAPSITKMEIMHRDYFCLQYVLHMYLLLGLRYSLQQQDMR